MVAAWAAAHDRTDVSGGSYVSQRIQRQQSQMEIPMQHMQSSSLTAKMTLCGACMGFSVAYEAGVSTQMAMRCELIHVGFRLPQRLNYSYRLLGDPW